MERITDELRALEKDTDFFVEVEYIDLRNTKISSLTELHTIDQILLNTATQYLLKMTLPAKTVVEWTPRGYLVPKSKKCVSDLSPVPVIIKDGGYEEHPELLSEEDMIADVALWQKGGTSYKSLYYNEREIVEEILNTLSAFTSQSGHFVFNDINDPQIVARAAQRAYEKAYDAVNQIVQSKRREN